MSLLHKLEWRYATKQFDAEKTISEENVTELLKAMNLSASSYGLQPYEFIVVKDQALQNNLVPLSYGQEQVADASHVIIIAAKTNIEEKFIQDYINQIAETRHQDISSLEGYKQMMLGSIGSQSNDHQLLWAQKQCYIVLGTLLLAAADLKIDACPMEGFNPDDYDATLGLEKKGLRTTLVIPIGYRSQSDDLQNAQKARRKLDDIVDLRYSE